jgi:hypothetical protein
MFLCLEHAISSALTKPSRLTFLFVWLIELLPFNGIFVQLVKLGKETLEISNPFKQKLSSSGTCRQTNP